MDNSAHCDDLLPSVLASKQAKEDLATLYARLADSSNIEPLLSSFVDLDHIRDTMLTYEGTDNNVQHLVYRDGHNKAGEEVVFSLAGYVGSFNLPGCSLTPREYYRPQAVNQKVTLVASSSPDFSSCMEAIRSLSMYLNQFSTDTAARIPSPRKVIGMDAIVAHTKLFTKKADVVDDEELNLPAYMDRNGTVLEEVRRRGFCYTQENDVEYAEITGATEFSNSSISPLHEKYSVESGVYRQGQLVILAVTVRSVRKIIGGKLERYVAIGLRGMTLVKRTSELALMKLRRREDLRREETVSTGTSQVRSPKRQNRTPLDTKEEYTRKKLGGMSIDRAL